jgi:hypothetical protein
VITRDQPRTGSSSRTIAPDLVRLLPTGCEGRAMASRDGRSADHMDENVDSNSAPRSEAGARLSQEGEIL